MSDIVSVQCRWVRALFVGACLFVSTLDATITAVQITTTPASPQLLGTTIQLSASAKDSDSGPLSYKFEVQVPGSNSFSLMQDFDALKTFTWAPHYTEGAYQLRLTARNYLAGTSGQQVITFMVSPLVTGSQPVVVATAHPLVALFSAPTCAAGSTIAVVFQQQGSALKGVTDSRPCHAGSENFYIGGMQANQTYLMYSQVTTGVTVTPGPQISFTTSSIPTSLPFPTRSVSVPPTGADTISDVLLSGYATSPDFPIATDLNANVIWYYTGTGLQLTRPVPGGTFLVITNGLGTGTGVWGPSVVRQHVLLEVDLVGNIVRQTNCDRVYEELQALGLTDPLGVFNHDAIRLTNGYTMVIGDVQRIFPAGTQGSSLPIDIIGEAIIILDQNFQAVSYWNAFDHACAGSGCIDINRPGDHTCIANPITGQTPGGCPPALLSSPANDWLHMNSLQYLPSDGAILASLRDQDWIIKIDYNNGSGTGNILWTLGRNGSFTLVGSTGEPFPWFSGQHDAGFIGSAQQTLTVFDNGTTRHPIYGGNSRGQVWNIDQTAMTATLLLNADLGAYSPALGSAQLMLNGDYMFFCGAIGLNGRTSYEILSTEYSPVDTIAYQYQALGPSNAYRGWRLASLYQAALNGSAGPE